MNILGDNFFKQICMKICMHVRSIYDSNIRLKYPGIMGFLTIFFTNIHHDMRWVSRNMADFFTNFNLEFLSNYKELGNKTYIFKQVCILSLRLLSWIWKRTQKKSWKIWNLGGKLLCLNNKYGQWWSKKAVLFDGNLLISVEISNIGGN